MFFLLLVKYRRSISRNIFINLKVPGLPSPLSYTMKKLWSEFKYWVFILIFLAILFELVASMILFRKYTTGKLAILHFTESVFKKGAGQKIYAMHKEARPGVSEEVNK